MAWFISTEYKDPDLGTYWSPEMKVVPEDRERQEQIALKLAEEIEAKYMAGPRDRNSPDYPWFNAGDRPTLYYGWRWPQITEPFRAQLTSEESAIVDLVTTPYGWAISQRVIDMIEAIEPGMHHYLPFEMLQPDGSTHPDKRWLLNVCTRAEVVDRERSNVQNRAAPLEYKFMDGPGERHLVVKADEAQRRAIWFEWRYHGAQTLFVSDALWNALQAADVRGWQPHFAYPHHIDEA